jgi:CRP-like cAMP-binding protein
MFSEYLDKLAQFSPLSDASKAQLEACLSVKTIPKGEYVLKHGEVCKHLYYVNKGMVRIFYYKNAKEITEWFADEKNFCFSITSYFNRVPSDLIIQAIEESEVIFLSKEKQYQLQKTNIEIANMMIAALSTALILSQQRMEALQFQTAKQRYYNLLKEHPEILRKAPLRYLASYLGMTQETLSRIRAK